MKKITWSCFRPLKLLIFLSPLVDCGCKGTVEMYKDKMNQWLFTCGRNMKEFHSRSAARPNSSYSTSYYKKPKWTNRKTQKWFCSIKNDSFLLWERLSFYFFNKGNLILEWNFSLSWFPPPHCFLASKHWTLITGLCSVLVRDHVHYSRPFTVRLTAVW